MSFCDRFHPKTMTLSCFDATDDDLWKFAIHPKGFLWFCETDGDQWWSCVQKLARQSRIYRDRAKDNLWSVCAKDTRQWMFCATDADPSSSCAMGTTPWWNDARDNLQWWFDVQTLNVQWSFDQASNRMWSCVFQTCGHVRRCRFQIAGNSLWCIDQSQIENFL